MKSNSVIPGTYHLASCQSCTDIHPVCDSFHYLSMLCRSYQIVADRMPANSGSYLIRLNFLHSTEPLDHVDSIIAAGCNSYMASAAYDSMKMTKRIAQ